MMQDAFGAACRASLSELVRSTESDAAVLVTLEPSGRASVTVNVKRELQRDAERVSAIGETLSRALRDFADVVHRSLTTKGDVE